MAEGQKVNSGTVASAPQVSRTQIFFRRLGSSVALWSFVLGALFAGELNIKGFDARLLADILFLIVMLAIAAVGLREFYALVVAAGHACFSSWGVVGGLILMTSTFIYVQGSIVPTGQPAKANDFETGILILFVLGLCFRQFMSKRGGSGLLRISTTLFGLMYVPWLLNFIQKLHFFPDVVRADGTIGQVDGNFYVLYFIMDKNQDVEEQEHFKQNENDFQNLHNASSAESEREYSCEWG